MRLRRHIRLMACLALCALALTAASLGEEAAPPEPAAEPEAGAKVDAATELPDEGATPMIEFFVDEPEATSEPEGSDLIPEGGMVPSVILPQQARKLPLTGVKIGIDPGHQGYGNSERETVAPNSSEKKAKVSSGTQGVATGVAEYVTVLQISLKLREALESQGAEVYMTRETHDVNISNQERAKMMNDYGVDLVLRIHCDGADNRNKTGIALYCSRSNSIAQESYRAAEAILPAVCEATGAKANGIVQNDSYTGQNWSEVPCVMVECGFMSNPDEDRLLNDEDYQWKLATGLTDGIMDYIAARDITESGE